MFFRNVLDGVLRNIPEECSLRTFLKNILLLKIKINVLVRKLSLSRKFYWILGGGVGGWVDEKLRFRKFGWLLGEGVGWVEKKLKF